MALVTFAFRYPAGRFVERYGSRVMTLPVVAAQVIGCVLAATAYDPVHVLIAGAFLGAAWSAVVPVGVGLFFEHSSPSTRGVAMGAYDLSFAIGTSTGALLCSAALAVRILLRNSDFGVRTRAAGRRSVVLIRMRREPQRRAGINGNARSAR